PLAFGKLTKSGTSSMAGVTNAISNFGAVREIAGAAARLGIQTPPSSSAVAGVAFAVQPVVGILDQFGNLRSQDNGAVVRVARGAGSGTLQGTTNATVANGLAIFANLYHVVATNITLTFTNTSLASTNSTVITITPAPADRLVFTTQPTNATVGAALL